MSATPLVYERRSPGDTVLYRIVRDHFETFRTRAVGLRDGEGLPQFVEQAFLDFLRCGWLAGGFARFHCAGCGFDRLVAFSCKGRALCPSCGGRRMAERAAHLVDRVLPDVPIRQWVLSVPYRLRYQLAWDHDLCRVVAGVMVRSICRILGDRARDAGVEGGRGGAVVVIQRFGGALNLNVHFHALVPDGVFAGEPGTLAFHRIGRLTALDAEEVLAAVEPLVDRRLRAPGVARPDWATASRRDRRCHWSPTLARRASTATASTQASSFRPASGPASSASAATSCGRRWRPTVSTSQTTDASASRSATRGATGRLTWCSHRSSCSSAWPCWPSTSSGHPEPRRGVVPRPRINLVLYFGVLGARAAARAEVVGRRGLEADHASTRDGADPAAASADRAASAGGRNRSWATLMQRTFGLDVLARPSCGGRLRLIALIERATVITRILGHLGLPTEVPRPRPARAPPDETCFDHSTLVGDQADALTPSS